jgi:DNA adenine methylase
MCGSLTVGLHVMMHYAPGRVVIGDASPDIVNFFKCVRDRYDQFLSLIDTKDVDEHTYYSIRTRFNAKADDPVTSAAQFYLLNRACFNGVYRVNSKGEFNVPFGRFRHGVCATLTPHNRAVLHRCHAVLKSHTVEFVCMDVEAMLRRYAKGPATEGPERPATEGPATAVVYCDPPYLTDSKTDLYASGFDEAKHTRLRNILDRCRASGTSVMINNANTDRVRALYASWTIRSLIAERTISADVDSRGVGEHEVLIY